MAADRDITPESLLVRQTHQVAHMPTMYRGTGKELIAAGVVQLRHLPLIGNERRTRAVFIDDELQSPAGRRRSSGCHMVVTVLPGKTRYQVAIYRQDARDDERFRAFMGRALRPVDTQALAEVASQPEPDPIERIRNAKSVDDYTDSDLIWLLRGAMLEEGVKPFSQADNILAHLRGRVQKRNRLGKPGAA